MEVKPLTKERREAIAKELERWIVPAGLAPMLADAMAAEQYWRGVVRDNGFGIAGRLDGDQMCQYCGTDYLEPPYLPAHHKPDCPWRLAQE